MQHRTTREHVARAACPRKRPRRCRGRRSVCGWRGRAARRRATRLARSRKRRRRSETDTTRRRRRISRLRAPPTRLPRRPVSTAARPQVLHGDIAGDRRVRKGPEREAALPRIHGARQGDHVLHEHAGRLDHGGDGRVRHDEAHLVADHGRRDRNGGVNGLDPPVRGR